MSQDEALKDKSWHNVAVTLARLKQMGAVDFFTKNFGNLNQALVDHFDSVVCMDEGTAMIKGKNGASFTKLCLAGSGILYPAETYAVRAEKVAKIFCDLGVKEVTSHDGCGAVKLFLSQNNPAGSFSAEEVNNAAREWGAAVVKEMLSLGYPVKLTHLGARDMARPKEYHNAIVIYYDAVGNFNPDLLGDAPNGFVINQEVFGKENARQELLVACGIAFGSHGFGERFNQETPFVVVPIIKDKNAVGDVEGGLKKILVGYLSSGRLLISPLVVA